MGKRKREMEKAKKRQKQQKQRQQKAARQQNDPEKWEQKRSIKSEKNNAIMDEKRRALEIPYECPLLPRDWPEIGQKCARGCQVHSCNHRKHFRNLGYDW